MSWALIQLWSSNVACYTDWSALTSHGSLDIHSILCDSVFFYPDCEPWVCEVVWQTSVYSITVGLWAILSCIITTWRITSTSNWNSQRAITRFPTSTPTCVFLSIIHWSKVDLKWSDLQAVTDSSSSKHRLTENMWLACFHSGNECLLKVEGFKHSKIKFYLLCGLDLAETKRKDMISDATLTNARKSSLH